MHKSFLLALMLYLLSLCLAFQSGASGEKAGEYVIHVDVESKTLTLFQGNAAVRRYTIATGAWDTPTPLGVFRINSRFSGQMSGFGTCFLGLNVPWGNYGIHGTDKPESIGSNASHGCIRMRVADAEELYSLVPNGTKVVIECGPYGELGTSLRTLKTATAPAWSAPCSASSAPWATTTAGPTACGATRQKRLSPRPEKPWGCPPAAWTGPSTRPLA